MRADCDVYFRKPVRLANWGTSLPSAVGLAYEIVQDFPYNAGGETPGGHSCAHARNVSPRCADSCPLGPGVALVHVPFMRNTHEQFVNWILAQDNGLYFEGKHVARFMNVHRARTYAPLPHASAGYGALDQGALNQFYERHLRGQPISQDFNAKPFQACRGGATSGSSSQPNTCNSAVTCPPSLSAGVST